MIVVCASESPRSAIISTRSRKLSLYRRYQRTQSTMISRSKWRPLKRSSTFNMLGQVHRGLICRRICATPTLRTRTIEPTSFAYTPGRGITTKLADDATILVGNQIWMTENGISVPALAGQDIATGSEVFVARDGRLLGSIA